MKAVIALIKKDITFNLKWGAVFIALCFGVGIVFAFDTDSRLTPIVFLFGSVLSNAWLVPKSCYLDDDKNTKYFLHTLPVKTETLVGSKYLLSLFLILITVLIFSVTLTILKVNFNLQSIMISIFWLLLYYSSYLRSFYKYNYSVAEKTLQAFQMLTIGLMFFLDRTGIVLDEMHIEWYIQIVGVLFASFVFYASFKTSCDNYRKPYER